MNMLERMRARWKHPDPAVRQEAVQRIDDQNLLESIAIDDSSEEVQRAAVRALADPASLARLATAAESAAVRHEAVGRIADRELLRRVADSDPDAGVRALARARCADGDPASAYLREVLSQLHVAARKAEQAAEFCGSLDDVCQALTQDPRFFINGGVAPEADDGAAQLADTTQVPWATAAIRSERVVARFVAQARSPAGEAARVSEPVRFYHIKVWRTAEDRFDAVAEEKRFAATSDAAAWSRASGGGPHTTPALRTEASRD